MVGKTKLRVARVRKVVQLPSAREQRAAHLTKIADAAMKRCRTDNLEITFTSKGALRWHVSATPLENEQRRWHAQAKSLEAALEAIAAGGL